MNKLKKPLIVLSVTTNILLLIIAIPFLTNTKDKIVISSIPPYDNRSTIYLAHGVITFKNQSDQPKNTYQIATFYIDIGTKKVFQEESILMDNVLTSLGRNELEVISYDDQTKIISLKGNGWEKVLIDVEKKELIEATDTTGDVISLKSSWDIK